MGQLLSDVGGLPAAAEKVVRHAQLSAIKLSGHPNPKVDADRQNQGRTKSHKNPLHSGLMSSTSKPSARVYDGFEERLRERYSMRVFIKSGGLLAGLALVLTATLRISAVVAGEQPRAPILIPNVQEPER